MGRIARSSRKRPALPRRMMLAAAALLLGGGGLAAVNVYASASESGPPGGSGSGSGSGMAQMRMVSTIDCPDVGEALATVPETAKSRVGRQLAALDTQITDAYTTFADNQDRIQRDPSLADSMVLAPLKKQRTASIGQIADTTGEPALKDRGLAACTMRADDTRPGPAPALAASGPARSDFVDIRSVRPDTSAPAPGRAASTGTFTSDCGRNENAKRNPDNVIVAPGVSNGAHHTHDYVGNQATDAFSSDADLARGATSCRDQGDRSTYYWPVVRVLNQGNDADARADGGGKDRNVGKIQTPAQATITYAGSPVSKVTAMPRFLRIITGDAKAFTNGNANANASWSCTGFENRRLKNKYPLCPQGSKVVRTLKFQSCWDGRDTDSANHRTHVAFADKRGACPAGFKAIPQLVQRIVYDVPAKAGAFAVDSFPEQLHKPVTDHGDFIDVFSDQLMGKVVNCINTGRACA
ncbi:DUF1996 domain-containing protein [Streptomyces sp. NPDC006704]|uniref:DUF1996 domain-containing protein n=1 Tax=Streptomyces sp. NPDC006704 TaxID=3364760 RepID=UPI0036ACD0AE